MRVAPPLPPVATSRISAWTRRSWRGERHVSRLHICGLPFFAPAYVEGNVVRLWASDLRNGRTFSSVIETVVGPPLFPQTIDVLKARLEFRVFEQGQVLVPKNGIVVRTRPLNHPGGATGYRLEYRNRAVAYVTDTEHAQSGLDENVLALAENADVLIYDCTYTDAEYPARVGWGHSTWQHGIALAQAARVDRFVIFHHDPSHDDAFLDEVALQARTMRPGSIVAREGLALDLGE